MMIKNKMHLQLKNGTIIKLSQQDIANNNYDKIKEKIPRLVLSNMFLPTGKIYKIAKMLEKGRQSEFLYYKILNVFSLLYILCISYMMIKTHLSMLWSVIMTLLWAIYALLQFQFNSKLQLINIKDIVSRSRFYPICKTSITYLFYIVAIAGTVLQCHNTDCILSSWQKIFYAMFSLNMENISFFDFCLMIAIVIAVSTILYDFYAIYFSYELSHILMIETFGIKIVRFILLFILLCFLPKLQTILHCDKDCFITMCCSLLSYPLLVMCLSSMVIMMFLCIKNIFAINSNL